MMSVVLFKLIMMFFLVSHLSKGWICFLQLFNFYRDFDLKGSQLFVLLLRHSNEKYQNQSNYSHQSQQSSTICQSRSSQVTFCVLVVPEA